MARYTEVQVAEAKRLHGEEGLSAREIARRLGVGCHKTVVGWIGDKSSPFSTWSASDFHQGFTPKVGSEALTPSKGYLLGVLCGDGSIWQHSCGSWYIGLSVSDLDFARAFAAALEEVYGVAPKVASRKHKASNGALVHTVQKGSSVVCLDLLALMDGKCRTEDWLVPECVKEANDDVKVAFVRGFFDSEGGLTGGASFQIVAWSRNEFGIRGVSEIAESLGVSTKVYTCMKRDLPYYALAIRAGSRRLFFEKVGFSIARKQDALRKSLEGVS